MAEYREPNIRARQLGDRLLQRMAEKGWGVREMSRRLEMSAQWVSAVTRGRARPSPVHLARFLTTLGFRGEEYRELMAMGDEMRNPGLLERSENIRTLISLEEHANAISVFQANVVPGLLQTGDYARNLAIEMGNQPELDKLDEHVFARLSRQAILTRPRVRFRFFLHEFVLLLPVGPPSVMIGQLRQLLRISAQQNTTVRIVPARLGGHAASAGHFQLMESDSYQPVVCIESEVTSLYLEEPREIEAYRRVLSGLEGGALDEANSKQFIADLIGGADARSLAQEHL
ncbi:helix-turn-helix transcriptional regulator [Amycolatopsis sp. A133]|uniref:helix-turn-helix domain-containing protein n=1 Tax=Amycolatopsis sp. A133 TaxID=3064472 RepID=UPI0027F44C9B|nr:helix-turn-helix transcriptional regulator [Amycolatopsis sp. A133]MDQ7807467.1 helix-turn-helix transcriptional regulator [Amycolatopsis sp. A133]